MKKHSWCAWDLNPGRRMIGTDGSMAVLVGFFTRMYYVLMYVWIVCVYCVHGRFILFEYCENSWAVSTRKCVPTSMHVYVWSVWVYYAYIHDFTWFLHTKSDPLKTGYFLRRNESIWSVSRSLSSNESSSTLMGPKKFDTFEWIFTI